VFSKFGKVTKLDFLFHKTGLLKGKPRGYAFVEYGNKDVSFFIPRRYLFSSIGGHFENTLAHPGFIFIFMFALACIVMYIPPDTASQGDPLQPTFAIQLPPFKPIQAMMLTVFAISSGRSQGFDDGS
jgi:hypothetical protein